MGRSEVSRGPSVTGDDSLHRHEVKVANVRECRCICEACSDLLKSAQSSECSTNDGGVAHSSIDGGSEAIYRPGHVPG